MLRLMVSAGMLAALALSMARRSRGLAPASPPPWRAATMISRMTRVQTLPRFSSWRPLRCWMLAHFECPAIEELSLPIRIGRILFEGHCMADPIVLGRHGDIECALLPAMANR